MDSDATQSETQEQSPNSADHMEFDADAHIDAGEPLLWWETWEYLPMKRGTRWYAVSGIIGAALIAYGLLTSNPLFSLIVLMIGVMTVVLGAKEPARVLVYITTRGIVIGEHFYPYEELKDFSLVYRPPEIAVLYLDFKSWLTPIRRVELEQMDPLAIRDVLLPVLPENYDRENELLTDLVKRVYKW